MADALELALALYQSPGLGTRVRARAVPADVLEVIRIASGDESAIDEGTAKTGLSRDDLREAAALYLQQALFHEGADSYRTLGLGQDAPQQQLKEHHRWLIHWLHPDRDRGAEFSVFSERINRAWNDLRSPERRLAYDQFLEARAPPDAPTSTQANRQWSDTSVGGSNGVSQTSAFVPSMLSGRVVRRLPLIVLGSLAVLTALLISALLMIHFSNESEVEPRESAPTAVDDSSAVRTHKPTTEQASAHVLPSASSDTGNSSVTRDDIKPAKDADVSTSSRQADVNMANSSPAVAIAAPDDKPKQPESKQEQAVVMHDVDTPATMSGQTASESDRTATTHAEPATEASPAAPPRRGLPDTPNSPRSQPDPRSKAAVPTPESKAADGERVPVPIVPEASSKSATEPIRQLTMMKDVAVAASLGAPSAAEAQRTLKQMQSAYGRGDLQAMMLLFVSNPRGESRTALADKYRELFTTSHERSLVLRDVGWLVNGDLAVGLGRYQTVVIARKGDQPRVAGGTIRVELRMEDGQARIVRMTHDHVDGS